MTDRKTIEGPRAFVLLVVLVVAWFCALSYLPALFGTCFDGACEPSVTSVALSSVVPLACFAMVVVLERVLFGGGPAALGLTRIDAGGIGRASLFLAPLLAFYPVCAWATGTTLAMRQGWGWMLVGVLLNNGLAEETMMRGFVYRHLREGRSFARAATITTTIFAAYHLPIVVSAGPVIGIAAVVLAVPAGFVTAWLYEDGRRSLAGPALMHTVHNALVMVVVLEPDVPLAPVLYMATSTLTAIVVLVLFARRSPREVSRAS